MAYATLFDIQTALPHCARNLIASLGLMALGLWLRTRRARRFAPARSTGLAVLQGFAEGFKPYWKVPAGLGLLFLLVTLVSAALGYREILELRQAAPTFSVEGRISRIDRWYTATDTRRGRQGHEALVVAGHRFEYGEFEAGSPYPLWSGPQALRAGSAVRILTDGRHILRVETAPCQIYPRCKAWTFLGWRFEQDLGDAPGR